MGRTSTSILAGTGHVYGGWIGLCLWIAFVLPCLIAVWTIVFVHDVIRAIIQVAGDSRRRRQAEARIAHYSNRR